MVDNNHSGTSVFNPIAHIRLRPGMYLGSTDRQALHEYIFKVIDNAVDLAQRGQCLQIWVTLSANNTIRIQDNGPGIPVDLYENTGKPIAELLFTRAAGRFHHDTQK